ncbi:MAG TPA: hypothetical protein VFT71_01720 [Candidatus Nitrosocosmicus sp.]|nr:hypothetical protein [Candidatus Nitrosocosmicus sp.]
MLKFIEDIHIPIRLSCISESGYPLIVSLMYVYMDEKFFCATQGTSKIVKSLKINSRCGFEIARDSPPYLGIRGYGNVTIIENLGEKILRMLLQRYFEGKESSQLYKFLLSENHLKTEVALVIHPIRIFEWDYSSRMKDLT